MIDEIAAIQEQVATLRALNDSLEAEIAKLTGATASGHYTFDAFLYHLAKARGKLWGARSEYIAGSTAEGCQKVDAAELVQWHHDNVVPAWAVEQIAKMDLRERGRVRRALWRGTENGFLLQLYVADPTRSNRRLADLCSEEFGRNINENAIRGKLSRLHRTGQVLLRKELATQPAICYKEASA